MDAREIAARVAVINLYARLSKIDTAYVCGPAAPRQEEEKSQGGNSAVDARRKINMLNITSDMLYLNAAGRYTYDLTSDVSGGITVAPGLGGILINGNGHYVTGSGASGLDLGTNNPYITVRDLTISGSFYDGVTGVNANGSFFNNVDVNGALHAGYDISGGGISIANANIHDIGGAPFPNKAFGINVTGSNTYITSAHIYGIHGASESVGISFDQTIGSGNVINNTTIDGTGWTGWSFGVWSSNTSPVTAMETYIHDVAQGAGAVGGLTFDHGTIANIGWIGQVTPINNSYIVGGSQHTELTLTGDNGRNFLVGGDTDQTLIGNGGHDVLYGFGGADTFVFDDASFSTIADFQQGIDHIGIDHTGFAGLATTNLQIGVYALGSAATFYWNPYDHSLNFDPDGLGGASGAIVAYIPTVATLHQNDLLLV